jgi:hypothetical protein
MAGVKRVKVPSSFNWGSSTGNKLAFAVKVIVPANSLGMPELAFRCPLITVSFRPAARESCIPVPIAAPVIQIKSND